MAPPGSAKSTVASIVAPTWAMGAFPGTRIIVAGHNSDIAGTQSKKARQVVRHPTYQRVFEAELPPDARAADEWALTNGSTLIAGGILSGIAGHRVDGIVFDDPHPSRAAAESETQRDAVWAEWIDNLRNRVTPGGWVIGMLTRWHESDWAGRILPEGWNGQSGVFVGSDGLEWEVVCLAAKIETPLQAETDPLHRGMGEYIWPEWFTEQHWRQKDPALGSDEANTPTGRRSWYSMEQQQPRPDDGVLFRREDFRWYQRGEEPKNLRRYAASDWALTDEQLKADPDFTEHGIAGLDDGVADGRPRLYLLDWLSQRKDSNITIPAFTSLCEKWRPTRCFGEQGNIETLVGPMLRREFRDRKLPWIERKVLKTAGQGNKVMKATAFRKMVELGQVWLPAGEAWAERLVDQCIGFPGAAHDDCVDVMSLFGRAMEVMWDADSPSRPPEREKVLPGPLTYEWHERMLEIEKAERKIGEHYFE
ncbi:MAG: terminase large subunit domain-containing protein [Burkholderiales bacterium]